MSQKGFNKAITPRCEYCIHGTISSFKNEVLCKKRGVTEIDDKCRHYKYDPLKREPKKIKISDNYDEKDFLLI